jgi:DNA polymerase I-like protein with 3'-5' exonuclease and polymerase domains
MSLDYVFLDFESYYADDYNLKGHTLLEYITDARFQLLGLSIKHNEEPTEWIPNTGSNIQDVIEGVEWDTKILVAHNCLFEAAILAFHFDVHPRLTACTMMMSAWHDGTYESNSLAAVAERHKLGEKGDELALFKNRRVESLNTQELEVLSQYCTNDTDLCFAAYEVFQDKVPERELEVMTATIRMYTQPTLEIDVPKITEAVENYETKRAELITQAGVERSVLSSNPQFKAYLESLGVPTPESLSKKNPEFTQLQYHENPKVATAVKARLLTMSTLVRTRGHKLIEISKRSPCWPIELAYSGAVTGRWTGQGGLNAQNLTPALKAGLRAPSGYLLINADLKAIEARILSWICGQNDDLADFASGVEIYKKMAGLFYNKTIEEVTDPERQLGKRAILGLGYQLGSASFFRDLQGSGIDIDANEACRLHSVYRSSHQAIVAAWAQAGKLLRGLVQGQDNFFGPGNLVEFKDSGVWLPDGFKIKYPNLHWADGELRYGNNTKIYGGKVIANICQALGRAVIAEHLAEVSRRFHCALTVHDSLVVVVEERQADAASEEISALMRVSPSWAADLPLAVEVEISERYGL